MTAADAITTYSPVAQTDKRVPLRLSPDEWIWPAVFMLGMTMVGLCFPLGYVVVLVAMLRSFHKSRYDFVIMLTIYAGGYSLALTEETFMTRGVVLLISIVAIFNIEKSAVVKRVLWGMLILFLIFSFFALRGVVGYFSQISPMLNRLSMIWFVVPLWAFRNQEFEIKEFFRRTVPYSMIVCIYYFLDAAVMGDQFFLPRDPMYSQEFKPTFYNLRLHMFSFAFARRWQPALYLLILSLYPAMRYYKLPVWMWAAVLVAMYIVRTFSVIMGFLVAALSLSRRRGQILKYIIIAAVSLTVLYFVDDALGPPDESGSTTLRIKSQIDQITGFAAIEGDEDALAEAGTGRGAQILPAFELFTDFHKEWTGFGFLSEESTPHQYFYDSEFIEDEDEAERLVTNVESEPFVVLFQNGYIGLIVHYGFFVWLWFVVRRMRYSRFFLTVLLFDFVSGLAGCSGLYRPEGLYLLGLSLACVILANRRPEPDAAE